MRTPLPHPALLLLAFTPAALADTTNTARAFVSTPFGAPSYDNVDAHPGFCTSTADTVDAFSTVTHGDARTDYGYMIANASAQGSGNGVGSGIIHDDLTFNVPGLPQFTAIQVTFSITVSGSLAASANGSTGAVWSAGANLNGDAAEINPFGAIYQNVPTGAPMGTYTGTAICPVGYPAPLHLELNATASAGYLSNEVPSASLSNITFTWGGISAVKRNGVPVASWSLTSASGTNWINAISPPPPTCPADLGTAGGVAGTDGVLDNNDFIAFITHFFSQNPAADLGSAGGVPGSDNQFDNNDFIAFITLFFAGC